MGLALGLSGVAHAQNARVTGTVTNAATGAPVEGARVVLKSAEMGRAIKAKTNEKGTYRAVNVRFGDYEMTVEADGYLTYRGAYTLEASTSEALVIDVKLRASPRR